VTEVTKKPTDFDRLGDLLKDVCGLPPAASGGAAAAGRDAAEAQGARSERADPQRNDPRGATRLLALAWPEIVGDEVAANATPVQLRQGRLVVSASSSAWAQTLQLMGDAVVARVNERLGPGTVERVVFRHAGWEGSGGHAASGTTCTASRSGGEAADLAKAPASRAEGDEEAAVAEVRGLGLGPELEEAIVRTVRASFRRS
jgi:hypothetical protein